MLTVRSVREVLEITTDSFVSINMTVREIVFSCVRIVTTRQNHEYKCCLSKEVFPHLCPGTGATVVRNRFVCEGARLACSASLTTSEHTLVPRLLYGPIFDGWMSLDAAVYRCRLPHLQAYFLVPASCQQELYEPLVVVLKHCTPAVMCLLSH